MKTAVLAMVLSIFHTPAPGPTQAANNQAGKGDKNGTKAQAHRNEAAPAPAPVAAPINTSDTAPQPERKSNPAAPSNAEEPIRVRELPPVTVNTDGWTKAYVILTGLLVAIGTIGVIFAVRTLRAIQPQSGIMQGQLKTMGEQVKEMRSSGQQTKELIEQAGRQVEQLTIAADAASKSADAAIRNAEAAKQAVAIVISKERARVSIIANFPPSLSLTREQMVRYKLHFSGPTTAFVLEARAGTCISESDKPPTSISMFDLPFRREVSPTVTPQWDTSAILFPRLEQESDLRAVIEGEKFIHFWCFIKYRDVFYDVFHEGRETRFRRVWKFADSPVGGNMPISTELGGRFGAWHTYGYEEDSKET